MERNVSSYKLAIAADQNVKEREYWLNKLSGDLVKSNFPYDFNRANLNESKRIMQGETFKFPAALFSKSMKLSKGIDVKLHMIMVTGLVILLNKYSGSHDIMIGSPLLKQDIQCEFINTILVFRNEVNHNASFKELLLQVKNTIIGANKNQNYPMERLLKRLNIAMVGRQFPLFDVVILLENLYDKRFIRHIDYNLGFSFLRTKESIEVHMEYNDRLYRQNTIKQIIYHYMHVLDQGLADLNRSISQIQLLSGEEKKQVLFDFNHTYPGVDYPADKTLQQLFAEQAARTPDHIALIGTASETASKNKTFLTYHQLNHRASQVAEVLKNKGIGPDKIVGLMVQFSIEMMVGIMAILKAGGAYLPLDPDYPIKRINYMLQDSAANVLVTTGMLAEEVEEVRRWEGETILLETYSSTLTLTSTSTCQVRSSYRVSPPATLAYVIYTSGTTGQPKGVMVQHRNVIAYLHSFYQEFEITAADTMIQLASYSFDAFVEEVFPLLFKGGKILIPAPFEIMDINALGWLTGKHRVSMIDCTPLLLNEFNKLNSPTLPGHPLKSIHTFISGGDVLKKEYVDNLLKIGRVYNTYGPTETTVCAAYYNYTPSYLETGDDTVIDSTIPIGKPIANYCIYILDTSNTPVPLGVTGELCISGDGVTRGYLNQPERTAEKFIEIKVKVEVEEEEEPREQIPNKHMSHMSYMSYIYKTGDLACWLPDGNIKFSGRKDDQVKIRGYRIETGEIEKQLIQLKQHHINEAIVTAREDEAGEKFLCAYIITKEEFELSQLRNSLAGELPEYMIPSFFVPIEEVPLTKNGKIDKKALPEPEINTGIRYVEPQNQTQKQMQKLWQEVLAFEPIGIIDNFFSIGGHSLKGIQLINEIHKEFNVKVPLAEIFKTPTIKELCLYIKEAEQEQFLSIEALEKKEYYALSSAQKRLYFIQQMEQSTSYNMPLILPLPPIIEANQLESSLKKLLIRHEGLRTSFITVNDEPVQKVHEPDEVEFELEWHNLEPGTQVSGLPALYQRTVKAFIRPFQLSHAPLIRTGILKLPDGSRTWILDIHHIISDGTSHTILANDFLSLYQEKELKPLRLQYKDFSRWQNDLFERGGIKDQENYWLKLYSDSKEISPLNLPYDYKRPEIFTFAGDHYVFILERETLEKLKNLGIQQGSTLYMNILAVLNTLFLIYTGQRDIIIGTGVAGRSHHDIQQIIGMFVNMLAMRNEPQEEKTFRTFLKEVIENSIKAFENQDAQFETLVDKLDTQRDPSRNPLFDISMVVQNFQQIEMENLRIENPGQVELLPLSEKNLPGVNYSSETSKFDMTFFISEIEENLHINIEYYTAIFSPGTVQRLAVHMNNVINAVIHTPSIPLKDIEIISEKEKEEVLYDFNDTVRLFPGNKTLHQLFEEQVEQNPDYIAIIDLEFGALTFRKLNEQANQVANYLYFEKHLQPEQPVGVIMERSLLLLVALLGILKAGAAYVPLDPGYPELRLKDILNEAIIKIVIAQKNKIKTLNRLQWECPSFETFLCLDSHDIYSEEEVEKCGLMDEKLWKYIGESSVDDITGGGWFTSTTGQPFSGEEMREYGDNILEKLKPHLDKNMRVLEIGCGSGITMYRIAPLVRFYYGTDLSGIIIEKNQEQIRQKEHNNIKLACLPAHEIHTLEEKNFDIVIINSVIQSFHGHNYLRSVIRQILDVMADKGILFIGDVMDQDLKEALIRYTMDFKRTHLDKNYQTKTDWSEELFISRAFFEDLTVEFPPIREVEFSNKIYTLENELTLFRYDALLRIDKQAAKPGQGQEKPKSRLRYKYQEDARGPEKYSTKETRYPGTVNAHQLAYVIYTSGSSGRPKGVMVQHNNVVRLIRGSNFIEWEKGDCLLPTGSIAFDISTFEIWAPLLNAIYQVLADESVILNDRELERVIDAYRVTHLHLIPQLFDHLAVVRPEIFKGLRCLLVGGDRVRPGYVNKIRKQYSNLKILHMYGPTENTTFSTFFPIESKYENSLPIGRPVANSTVYILDKYHHVKPIGVYGELCTGGSGVARGYLNNPELTSQRFINYTSQVTHKQETLYPYSPTHPLTPFHSTIYRTGDLARWNAERQMEFAGRMDQQVKIRGFRIETGEIENRLLHYPGIKEAIVIARTDETGDPYLCAYMVPANDYENEKKINVSDLDLYLSTCLPNYMIPSKYVIRDKLPVTSSGKVDRKSLPDPQWEDITGDYTPPQTPLQKSLIRIWADILGIDKSHIGIDSNFFQLGGHSLKATILFTRIHKELNIQVPLAEIFTSQTIRKLSRFIEGAAKNRFTPIKAIEEKEYYTLSSAQKRLYILQQMELSDTLYNMPQVIPLPGEWDIQKIENIFRKLIRRHESLRTDFHIIDGEPVQRIHKEVQFEIEYYDMKEVEVEEKHLEGTKGPAPLSKEPAARSPQPAAALISSFSRSFDLSRAPLVRIGLINMDKGRHILMVDMHHIITDGFSQANLEREFAALLAEKKLPSLRLQYKDYAEWQNSQEQQEIMEGQEKYWLREFSGDLPVLNLITDYPRPIVQSFQGRRLYFFINKEITNALKMLSGETGATLYMILLTALNVLLSKLSGQEEIIIGIPTAGRRHADLQDIIGMFINMLSMKNYPIAGKKFIEFLNEVKERTLEAYENQEYQFEDLVDKISVGRDTSKSPIFDVVFNFLNLSDYRGNIKGTDLNIIGDDGECETKFDIIFQGVEIDIEGVIYFTVEYCTKLYRKETIKRFINFLKKILLEIKDNPEKRLSALELIPGDEKQQILLEFNNTAAWYPREKNLGELFAEQASAAAHHAAAVSVCPGLKPENERGIRDNMYITYRQLNQKSNQLAARLQEKGVKRDTVIGLMVDQSQEMLIGLLGIIKASGAYLPIDPEYPEERKKYMMRDSNSLLLLTQGKYIQQMEDIAEIIRLENDDIYRTPGNQSKFLRQPGDLAYVTYTSGSTGKPKGVMVDQQNVVRLVKNTNYFQFKKKDRLLQTGALEFDASTFEIWGSILNGLTLYFAPKEDILTAGNLKKTIQKHHIGTMWLTSPLFNQLCTVNVEIFGGLRNLLVGGDVLSPVHINMVKTRFPTLNIINGYGPTENTTFSTTFLISRVYEERIPIGAPISNSTAYIVDRLNKLLLPIGVPGELCVGGDGVARGYLNSPELTKKKFLENPFNKGKKLYRTGDTARWLPDGNIEFLGRIDHQVKIRGYRIESGEIERQLLNHTEIREVMILAETDESGDKYLCAYIVSNSEKPAPAEFREYLSGHLPDYMIPSYFVFINNIPLTPNGKIDRKALPEPELKKEAQYAPPRDEVEKKMVDLWSEVLGVNKDIIGINSNFFEIGGHSLKATILVSKLHKALDVKIPLTVLFRTPTIKDLALYIKGAKQDKFSSLQPAEKKDYYPLSPAQKRLYISQQMNIESISYNMPEVVILEGILHREKLEKTFSQLIKRHEILRTSFEMVNDNPVQKIHQYVDFRITYSLPAHDEVEKMIANFVKPFYLEKVPLIRIELAKIQAQSHILLIDLHHIVADGISIGIFIREFMALYNGETLPHPRLQYKDFSQWQTSHTQMKQLNQQEAYWLKELAGEITILDLPFDDIPGEIPPDEGLALSFEIKGESVKQLKKLAIQEDTTMFMLLLAVFNVLLAKITGQEDIIVGTALAGRTHVDLEPMIGLFLNTIPLRNHPLPNQTFLNFLREVKQKTLAAFENQSYPFEELAAKIAARRNKDQAPIFNVMFGLQNIEIPQLEIPGIKLKPYPFDMITSKFDLIVLGVEGKEQLAFNIQYRKKLFKPETIERFCKYFRRIVSSVIENPEEKIKDIKIISRREEDEIISEIKIKTGENEAEFDI
ncbi:MAG: amino acid adenylation domain-containing protein [Candidatus Aminicenantes bacterium]|nr:MAG: amino acid adenylation domain-containing protein [Candidatus Aminicenantes bacterium]